MGWFDKQIRQRMQSDQDIFEESFVYVAGSVLGTKAATQLHDERLIAREALDDILKYYHFKAPEVPDTIQDMDEQMEFILRPLGLMTREVELTEGWYKNAFGPMLGFIEETGSAVALMPGRLHGYWYKDPDTGKKVVVNRKTVKNIDRDALCFYRPLPMKKLGIPDLLNYMKNCISERDVVLIVLATLAVTLVGFIEPKVFSAVTGPVLKSKNPSLLVGMAVFLLCAAFSSQLISVVKEMLMGRINTKTSLAVEASVMMRILSLPMSFFRKYASGELSSRAEAVNSLCEMLLGNILSTGLTSLISLLYITQIFDFAPALVVPSLVIILSTVIISVATSFVQIRISRKKMQLSAKESGMSYAMVSGVQKIKLTGAEKRGFARWARLYSQCAELEYNPPLFLKINGVITMAISLVGTIVLYAVAVRTGVAANEYIGFSAAYARVMGAFTALAGIAIAVPGGALCGWWVSRSTGSMWPGFPHHFAAPWRILAEGAAGSLVFVLLVAVPTAILLVDRARRAGEGR